MQQQTETVAPRGPGTSSLRPELRDMKIIGVEEHTTFPHLLKRFPSDNHALQIYSQTSQLPSTTFSKERNVNLGNLRLKEMDESGTAVQILSFTGVANSTHFTGKDAPKGVALAREINDELKKAVDAHPTRFKAFAELPFQVPHEAVKELHRCVKELGFVGAMLFGSVGASGKFFDAPEFDEVLSAFEELDVPLFLHPGVPPKSVWDTYYAFPGNPGLSGSLALGGWGWHNEVAVHVLRLALTGALDRHRRLKIIVGHQGEMMPMMMQRFDTIFDERVYALEGSVGEMLRSQVWISISGLFSLPPTQAAISTWGVDRVLFANDYPFISSQGVQNFICALGDVVAPSDLRKICQTNAEELLKFKA